MKYTSIHSIDHPFFKNAWELYINAFPIDERRDLNIQKLIFKHSDYRFEIISIDNEFIGFIAWWQFNGLRFIEHFATLDKHRGKGFGKIILEQFILESNGLTILEVEHPISTIDQRRIKFYERLNFQVNSFKYQQLP